jgi:hypothetical protein
MSAKAAPFAKPFRHCCSLSEAARKALDSETLWVGAYAWAFSTLPSQWSQAVEDLNCGQGQGSLSRIPATRGACGIRRHQQLRVSLSDRCNLARRQPALDAHEKLILSEGPECGLQPPGQIVSPEDQLPTANSTKARAKNTNHVTR